MVLTRQYRTERDFVRAICRNADITFVLDIPFGCYISPNVMRIDRVRTHTDRFRRRSILDQFVLSHHEFADHATGFANVHLMRPMPVVTKFVGCESPISHRRANVFGHSQVICEKVHQALLITSMFQCNFVSLLVTPLRIVVVHSDVVGAEGTMIIGVGLAVWNRVEFFKCFSPASVQDSQ